MRKALSGRRGTVVGPDYRGVTVLAAYEPVSVLDLGIVAKIDLAEIRAPFLRAVGIVLTLAIALIAAGTILYVSAKAPIRDRAGKPYAICGISIDVTELERRVEERTTELRHSLRHQRIIADLLRYSLRSIPLEEMLKEMLSLVLTSHELRLERKGCILLADDNTKELVMAVRQGLPDSITESCRRVPFGTCICGCVAESGKFLHVGDIDARHELMYAGMTPHGHYCAPIESNGNVFGVLNLYVPAEQQKDEAEERFVTSVADTLAGVIQRKLSEAQAREHQAQLAHVARLGTAGEMATGIAHEVNQPLTAMVTDAQACLRLIDSGKADLADLRESMQEIAAQGLRAGEIIRRLRAFTRMRKTKRTAVGVNEVVREAVRFVEAEIREKDLVLNLELADRLPPIEVDTIQIEQVILNLLRNAMEALDDTAVSRREMSIRTASGESAGVELSVSDSGAGLLEEIAERIFEPFVSTKPQGMGMGLSISRSIVQTHGGRLWIDPPDGKRTVFRLALPSTSQEARNGG